VKGPFNNPVALIALIFGIGIGWVGSRFTPSLDERASTSSDFGSALLASLAEGSPSVRLVRLAQTLEFLDADNVETMVQIVDRERTTLAASEIQLFFDAWARLEPEAALEHPWNERWPDRTRVPAVGAAVERWGLSDPLTARQFVDHRLDVAPRLGQKLIHPFVSGWVYSGVPGFFEYILELPVHLRPTATVAMVAAQARRLGVEDLLTWANSRVGQGNETLPRDFFRRVTKAAARRDPAATGAWVLTHADQEYAVDGVRLVAERWLPHRPDEAFAWVAEEAPENFRVAALSSAAGTWMTNEIDSAREWLEAQSLGPSHDPILDVYARQLARTEAGDAVAWAERIHDTPQRTATLETVAGLWFSREPEAAEAWLETSSFDEAARAAIRSAPRGSDGPRRGRARSRANQSHRERESARAAADTPS